MSYIDDPDQIRKLNELERREFQKMLKDEWYLQQPEKIQRTLRTHPPFMLYRLKDNEMLVTINEYMDSKSDPAFPVVMQVQAHPDFNRFLMQIHQYDFVPQEALQAIALRSVAQMEGIMNTQRSETMRQIKLANRAQAMRRAQKAEKNAFGEKNKWQAEKEKKTFFGDLRGSQAKPDLQIYRPGDKP